MDANAAGPLALLRDEERPLHAVPLVAPAERRAARRGSAQGGVGLGRGAWEGCEGGRSDALFEHCSQPTEEPHGMEEPVAPDPRVDRILCGRRAEESGVWSGPGSPMAPRRARS